MNEAIKKTMFEDVLLSKVKLICKKREEIIDEFEKGFEGDYFLKLDKLESTFNFFLINVYHKYKNQRLGVGGTVVKSSASYYYYVAEHPSPYIEKDFTVVER